MTDETVRAGAGFISERCRQDIYEEGTAVFVTADPDAAGIEEWVSMVRERSGQPVDWHYVGGRGVVKALGDLGRVRSAVEALLPEHDRLGEERYERDFRVKLGIPYSPNRRIVPSED